MFKNSPFTSKDRVHQCQTAGVEWMNVAMQKTPLQPNPAEGGYSCKQCGGTHFKLHEQWDVGDYWNQTKIR